MKRASFKNLDNEEKCSTPEALEKRLTIRLHGGERLMSDSVQYHEVLLGNDRQVFRPAGGPSTNDRNSDPECQIIESCKRSATPVRAGSARSVFNPYSKRQKRGDKTNTT